MSLSLVPVFQREAKLFIGRHHRHNIASITAVFQLGVAEDGELIGVAMVGLPKARRLMDGATLEVTRTCVKGEHKNANSMLYGACARAATALGYRKLITYTLPGESGASLKAAGWSLDGEFGGDVARWVSHAWKSGDMFGNPKLPEGPKLRWRKDLPRWP